MAEAVRLIHTSTQQHSQGRIMGPIILCTFGK